jgi:protein TonB
MTKKDELVFSVIEEFKVEKSAKSNPKVNILKPVPKKMAKPKKRQVYGLSRKAQTSKDGVAAKKGNTIAKTPDNKVLNKDDEDSIPIPTDEFLITSMPTLIEEIRPDYPVSAKKEGIQGKVIFEIIIDAKGIVRSAKILKSLGVQFDATAKAAILQFRFKPAKMADKSVAVKIKYAINFVLEE